MVQDNIILVVTSSLRSPLASNIIHTPLTRFARNSLRSLAQKKLDTIYKRLSVVNKRIHNIDMGEKWDEGGAKGCCDFTPGAHVFMTTGYAFVTFRHKKEAAFCLEEVRSARKSLPQPPTPTQPTLLSSNLLPSLVLVQLNKKQRFQRFNFSNSGNNMFKAMKKVKPSRKQQ